MGGIRIDPDGWTGVPGLYAGGEAAGGLHGASRIAGNGGAAAVVFGALAGQGAAQGAMAAPRPRDPRGALDQAGAGLDAFVCALGRTDCQKVQAAIRRTMSQYLGLHRDGEGLSAAAACLADLERSLHGDGRPADLAMLLPALSVRNMLLAARLITQAALLRTESRGAHQRADYPARDDSHWLRHITFRAGPTGEPVVEMIPIA